jgi:hypothetical protein
VNADASSIYIKEGDKLKFSYTQNDMLQKRLPPGKKLVYSTLSIPINNHSISGYAANNGNMPNIFDACHLQSGLPDFFTRQGKHPSV